MKETVGWCVVAVVLIVAPWVYQQATGIHPFGIDMNKVATDGLIVMLVALPFLTVKALWVRRQQSQHDRAVREAKKHASPVPPVE